MSCTWSTTNSAPRRSSATISAGLAGQSVLSISASDPIRLDKAIGLVDVAPDVQFVLDHCGVPAISNRDEHPWRERITEIAQRPNVAVKISGVVAYADADTWTVDDLRPYVEHAIGSFGWDRVIWGSDWPVCTLTASLSLWVAATHALTLGCSVTERRKLLCDNARRLWNVGAPQ